MPAPIHEISTRATAPVIELLERWGEPVDDLAEGLPVDLSFLRNPRHVVEWDDFSRFLDNVRDRIGADRIHDMGPELYDAPSWDWPRRFAGYAIGPRQLFAVGVQLFSPSVFPCIEHDVQTLPDGRLRVWLHAPRGGRPSLVYFQICRSHLQSFTRLIGAGDAKVEAEVHPDHGLYLITLPPPQPVFERATRIARAVLRAPLALKEITRHQEELKRSYDALARSRRELHELVTSLPVGVGMHRNGVCVYANDALARLMGFEDARTLVGVPILDMVHPEDRERVAARAARSEAGRKPTLSTELRFLRRDGSVVVVETTPMAAIEYGGAPAHVVVVRDLTQEKQMREQLMLADRMASLGTLAAGVAHEINNPLTYLRGSLDIISREIDRIEAKDAPGIGPLHMAREALRAAVDGAKRVSTIVGDLRTFSRPSNEPTQAVDLEEVVDATLRVAAKQVRSRARLVCEYERLPRVMASPARLGQVFLNLILNAVQATPEGEPDAYRIVIRTRSVSEGRVAVEVSDTGVGIPEEMQGRIFDPFFTTKHGVGTGLGLPISHAIVTRLGGTIEVESRVGQGTTMRVVLPVAAARRESERAQA